MTTIASGSSVTITVNTSSRIAINSAQGVSAVIEAVSGVPGSAVQARLVNHTGGFAVYGPFGSGTVKISAIGGSVDYDDTNLLGSDARSVVQSTAGGELSSDLVNVRTSLAREGAVCCMGDSIAAQNTSIVGGTYNYLARGPVAWAMAFLGHPWAFEPSDNYATSGATLNQIISDQLQSVLTASKTRRYIRCFISAGTNDTNAGRSVDDIKKDFLNLFDVLRKNGITPFHTGIRPRGVDVAITNAKKQNIELNQWLYQMSLEGKLEYFNVSETYSDNAAAFGNALTSMMYDSGTNNLHPNCKGAALEGKAIADYFVARGVVPKLRFAIQQSDAFDRTYNPSGVAFASANPLLQGGTTAPTGMTTSGGTWSKVNRTLANGQTRSDASCALAASTVHYLYDDWVGSGAWGATQLQPGDIIEARAKITLASAVAVKNVQIRISESDGTTALVSYGLFANESGVLTGDYTLYLKTPRITIRPYSGSGNVSVFARAECETDSGASGTFVVQQLEIRKVG